MYATLIKIAHIAAKVGIALVKAINVVVKVTTPVSKALAIPASVAGKIAIKAGLPAKTVRNIQSAVKLGTAIAANTVVKAATSNLPSVVAKPIDIVSKITIARSFGY